VFRKSLATLFTLAAFAATLLALAVAVSDSGAMIVATSGNAPLGWHLALWTRDIDVVLPLVGAVLLITGAVLLWRRGTARSLAATLVAALMLSGCASRDPYPPDPNDGNPLVLLAAGVAAGAIQQAPNVSPEDKAMARAGAYEQAYRYTRAIGMTPSARERYAKAFADDTPLPELTCADWVEPPPDCGTDSR